MEAASTSETSVNVYETSNNLEDSPLHNRRRENVKSHWTRLVRLQSSEVNSCFTYTVPVAVLSSQ
jgi:hypothetical protein